MQVFLLRLHFLHLRYLLQELLSDCGKRENVRFPPHGFCT